jgi:mannosyltransferase
MSAVPHRSRRLEPLDWLVIALPAALAAMLCAWKLSTRSLWLDEGASVSIASQHGDKLWSAIAHDGGNMLIYYLALHVVISLFGDGETALRMISLLSDVVTAGLVGALALALFASRGVALVAGVLTAVSVGLVFWGQDARGYAAMVTAATASFYALVVLLQSEPRYPPPALAVIGYVLATALSLYLGFDAVLLIPAQLLIALMLHRRLSVLIGALVLVAALCVPLVVLAVDRGSGQLFWVPPLSVTVLWQTLSTLVSSGLPPNFHTTVVTEIGAGVFSGAGLCALVLAWRSRWEDERAALVLVPVLWLLTPLVLGVLAAAVGEPVELARISILMMPALSLLLAWLCVGPRDGLAAVPGRLGGPSVSLSLGLGLLGVILALRLAVLIPSYGATPEPWKQVAARVLAGARPTDCVAFYPQDGRMPFGYYVQQTPGAQGQTPGARGRAPGARGRAPRPLLPVESWASRTPHVEQYDVPAAAGISGLTRGCGRVWLLSSHQGQRHGTAISRRNYAGYEAIQRELSGVYSHRTVARYGYAARITVFLYTR